MFLLLKEDRGTLSSHASFSTTNDAIRCRCGASAARHACKTHHLQIVNVDIRAWRTAEKQQVIQLQQ